MEARISKDLESRLLAAKLPTMPGVAVQLLHIGQSDGATIKDLVQVIGADPAIAALLLKLANSAAYVRSVPAADLLSAVRCLGYENARATALTATVVPALHRSGEPAFAHKEYWRRSAISAVCARVVGHRWYANDVETLFLGTLIQDIGILALAQTSGSIYAGLDESSYTHEHAITKEKNALDADHAEVGSWLLERWKFPAQITEAVVVSNDLAIWRAGHKDDDTRPNFAACVLASGLLADLWMGHEDTDLEQLRSALLELLPVSWSEVVQLLSDAMVEIPMVESLCQVYVPDLSQLQLTLSILRDSLDPDG